MEAPRAIDWAWVWEMRTRVILAGRRAGLLDPDEAWDVGLPVLMQASEDFDPTREVPLEAMAMVRINWAMHNAVQAKKARPCTLDVELSDSRVESGALEARSELLHLMKGFTDVEKLILQARFVNDMHYADIATIIDCAPSYVRKIVNRLVATMNERAYRSECAHRSKRQ